MTDIAHFPRPGQNYPYADDVDIQKKSTVFKKHFKTKARPSENAEAVLYSDCREAHCWKEKQQWHRLHFQILINNKHWEIVRLIKKINKKHCTPATTSRPPLLWSLQTPEVFSGANLSFLRFWHWHWINLTWQDLRAGKSLPPILLFLQPGQSCSPWSLTHSLQNKINPQ